MLGPMLSYIYLGRDCLKTWNLGDRMRQEIEVETESIRADRITLGEWSAHEEVRIQTPWQTPVSVWRGMSRGGEVESLLSLARFLQTSIRFYS